MDGVEAGDGAEGLLGHQVDLGAEDSLQFSLDPSQPEQAHVRGKSTSRSTSLSGRSEAAIQNRTIYLEERSDVNRYALAFDRLRAASLHPDDSVQLIEQAASIMM